MRIAIIGCGMGGLAAATALARDGHEAIIFERFETAGPAGAGLLLQPSGRLALRALGCEAPALERGARVDALTGSTWRGRKIMDIRYEDGMPGAFGLGIRRSALFETLHQAALQAGVTIKTGCPVLRIEDHDHPRLIMENGSEAGPFDLAIVADGAFSALRTQIAPKASSRPYPWGALWALRADPDQRWANCLSQIYLGAHVMIGMLPVGISSSDSVPAVALFWSVKSAAGKEPDGERARMKRAIARYWPEAAETLGDETDDFAYARYCSVAARPWTRRRTILIGDAAHGMSPQLGQGANLALIDGVELAGALRAHRDPAVALPHWRKARSSHTAYYQFASRWLTPLFQSDSRIGAFLRDVTFPLIRFMPILKGWTARTLTGFAQFSVSRWKPKFF